MWSQHQDLTQCSILLVQLGKSQLALCPGKCTLTVALAENIKRRKVDCFVFLALARPVYSQDPFGTCKVQKAEIRLKRVIFAADVFV